MESFLKMSEYHFGLTGGLSSLGNRTIQHPPQQERTAVVRQDQQQQQQQPHAQAMELQQRSQQIQQ